MKNNLVLSRLRPAARIVLGTVLLVAALGKLTHLTEFVQAFAVIPGWASWRPWIVLVPAAEVIVGVRLIANPKDETASGLSVIMFTLFLAYQLAVATRTGLFGRPVNNCPCFTFGSTETWPQYYYILRNCLFLGLALAAFPLRPFWRRGSQSSAVLTSP